jgi:hypothetical protein
MRCLVYVMAVLLGMSLCLAGRGLAASPENARLLDILVAAYPEQLAHHAGDVLIWKDGTRMTFDDGVRRKDFERLLAEPSLKDQFYVLYPAGQMASPPGVNSDPGRVRHQPFFVKMYGDCRKGEVEPRLVDVVWLPRKWGRTLRVTRVNGVAERLKAVSAELDRLPATFDPYLYPSAGTFNCRAIGGTDRLSPHSFGIAIDLATTRAHSWEWAKPDAAGRFPYTNAIPMEVVTIFEKHGFIWGGRWYHYDTMHFEYRPELIQAGRGSQRPR